ncbi:hypothetical protein [Rubritalea tangerina]|uniref:hypothetical protein n=1 Tax=Rubritalea tangerina TaxID=430798 RepID=UPI003610B99E
MLSSTRRWISSDLYHSLNNPRSNEAILPSSCGQSRSRQSTDFLFAAAASLRGAYRGWRRWFRIFAALS